MSRNHNFRSNRWEEISQQEQLILAKKREIEERLKASTGGKIKSESVKSTSLPPTTLSLEPSSSVPITIKTEDEPNVINLDSEKPSFANKFQNDGSFLEMFRKMQQQKQQNAEQYKNSSIIKQEDSDERTVKKEPKLEDIDERIRPLSKGDCDMRLDQTKVSPSEDREVRMAIEKSAIYVAMNGSEAEAKLKSECINDSDYRWLYQEDNVNHQYYKRRIEELKEAKTRATHDDGPSASTSLSLKFNSNESTSSKGCDRKDIDERRGKRKKGSRWVELNNNNSSSSTEWDEGEASVPLTAAPQDSELIKYAIQVYGRCDLTADQWKQLEDQRKMKILVQMMQKKKHKREKLEKTGRHAYEYDSDEEVEGGTWEHKKRMQEMEKTKEWAIKMTEMNKGKHHIGDFLPPDQLERFMKKWDSIKDGSTSLLFDEDYKDFKLQSENQGYKMLEKLGWTEGQGLGVSNQGTTKPVDTDANWGERTGLGQQRPDELRPEDDEYEAYRKRMMLAYRFRPNPLNNPRRPYY